METHSIYRCAGCGYASKWPLQVDEIETCSRMERNKRIPRMNWIVSLGLIVIGIVMLVVR